MKRIRLVIADLDGTLLDPQKRITPEAAQVIRDMDEAGIRFTLVSGRPPFGMRSYSDILSIKLPIAGFNGGEITTPDFFSLQRLSLPPNTSQEVEGFFEEKKLKFWIYRGSDWMVLDPGISHAANEATNVGFMPSVVSSFDGRWDGLTKLVGISDDHDYLAHCEREMQERFRGKASAARSQPYYLDVTHPKAYKEAFVEYLSKTLSISRDEIGTIGDMPSDLSMFRACGLAIAMGNAHESVKAAAHHTTLTNSENGFAHAMREFVLNSGHEAAA